MNLARKTRRKSLLGTHSKRNMEAIRLQTPRKSISPILDNSSAENETIVNDNTILSTINNNHLINYKSLQEINNANKNNDGKSEILLMLDSLIAKKMTTIEDLKLQIEDLKKIKSLIDSKCEINQKVSVPASKFLSPKVSFPSQQIMKEMQSTLKIFRTPRLNRKVRNSIILTPGSMTFHIQSQCKKLFE